MTQDDDEQTVCFCHNVSKRRIREAIRAGAGSIYDIQRETCASTGCGGCEYEVLDILEEELLLAQSRRSGEGTSDPQGSATGA